MATVGIYDVDFFHYQSVMPNLDCAKLYTYHSRHNDIAVLTPILEPGRYTKFYVRKDYDDGIYLPQYFESNSIYGGRAFNPDKYKTLGEDIENVVPDMSIYKRYETYYGTSPSKKAEFKRLMNCAHIRLSNNGTNIANIDKLLENLVGKTGIVLHDYNPNDISNAFETVKLLSESRKQKDSDISNPLPIGSKFPIQVSNIDDLLKWNELLIMPQAFYFQYNGLMDENGLNSLINTKRWSRQYFYDPTRFCTDEDDFVQNILPIVFDQILFLRKHQFKILLIYNDLLIQNSDLRSMLELLNLFANTKYVPDIKNAKQNLYRFCKFNKQLCYKHNLREYNMTVDAMRNGFQYIREHNYNLFKKFYEAE